MDQSSLDQYQSDLNLPTLLLDLFVLSSLLEGCPLALLEFVLFKSDFSNAFNSLPRAKLGDALLSSSVAAPLRRLFWWAYDAPSPLLLYDHSGRLVDSLDSACGVKQGDPVAALAFALTVQPLYQKCVLRTGGRHDSGSHSR